MATTTTAPTKPAEKLSPADLVEALMDLAQTTYDYKVCEEVREAERRLDAARAKENRIAEKKLRILRAATVEEAQRIRDEKPADENLKKLCQKVAGWKPLQEKGATDDEIKALLSKWPKQRPYNAGVPSCESGYGANQHYAWVDPDKSTGSPAHLSGQKLVDAVRRVMGIGKPAAPKPEAKKPAKAPAAKSKPKAAAATPAKADPADAGGGDDDDDAGGAEDASGGDPNVNKCGVFVRGVKGYSVRGVPKPASVTIRTAMAAGGTWRSAYDVRWGSTGGSCSGVQLRSTPYGTEADAIAVQAEWILEEFKRRADQKTESDKARSLSRRAAEAVRAFMSKSKTPSDAQTVRRGELCAILHPPKKAAASGGVKFRPQTWGQWTATLRAIPEGVDLPKDLPDRDSPTEEERFFLDQFAKKKRPADARDAWRRHELAGPPKGPSVAALDHPQTPMPTAGNEAPARLEPRSYQDPAEVGVTPAELEASMAALMLRPPSPQEKAPLIAVVRVLRLRDGNRYAVIGCRVWNVHRPFRRVDTYTLRRLYDPVEWQDKTYATWAGLPGADRAAPEDVKLGGLVVDDVDDPDGPPWILADAIEQLHVDVIGEPAAKVIETKELGPADQPTEAELRRHHGRPSARAFRGFPTPTIDDTAAADEDDDDDGNAKCRVCGCTEDDCSQCIKETGAPCRWVDDPILNGDLCSACRPPEYGRRVSGVGLRQTVHYSKVVILGQGRPEGVPCYMVQHGFGNGWVRKAGAELGEQTIDAMKAAGDDPDPNVDGRGEFVSGVEEVWAWRDKRGEIRIRVAQGADQLWRTGHQVEFVGADVFQADTEQAVVWAGQAVESREYAIRARANVLLNRLRAGDGVGVGPSGKWSTRQKAVYGAAIKALDNFIAHNPACRTKPRAAAKAG